MVDNWTFCYWLVPTQAFILCILCQHDIDGSLAFTFNTLFYPHLWTMVVFYSSPHTRAFLLCSCFVWPPPHFPVSPTRAWLHHRAYAAAFVATRATRAFTIAPFRGPTPFPVAPTVDAAPRFWFPTFQRACLRRAARLPLRSPRSRTWLMDVRWTTPPLPTPRRARPRMDLPTP